jgi:F-type H+-transporting ATPase subunit epsilon
MKNLLVEIVSPSGKIFSGEATGVQAPGVSGSFEVLRNHAPMIAAFEIGTIRVTVPSGNRIMFATSGGFLEVMNNTVSVLAESAELPSDIDVERAKRSEERAKTMLAESGGSLDRERAMAALERARNRVRNAMSDVGADSHA